MLDQLSAAGQLGARRELAGLDAFGEVVGDLLIGGWWLCRWWARGEPGEGLSGEGGVGEAVGAGGLQRRA